MLTVTDPLEGATVTSRTYRFRGATEPDCVVVAAGRYEAPVAADGSWSIVLILNPGGNVATISATDPAGNVTTVRRSVFYVPAAPDYLRYGPDGLDRIANGKATRLVDGPIAWADGDHMGGIFYTIPEDSPNIFWLTAGSEAAIPISGYEPFTGIYDGRPYLFYRVDRLVGRDLLSGAERQLVEFTYGDIWERDLSFGGRLFVAAEWWSLGPFLTGHALRAWDEDGLPTQPAHLPFTAGCEPCELTAQLSPDGTLLAVRHRPDANWFGAPHENEDPEEWWRQSRHIDANLYVYRLADGEQVWTGTAQAEFELADFDGRYLVITDERAATPRSSLIDTELDHTVLTTVGRLVLDPPAIADVDDIESQIILARQLRPADGLRSSAQVVGIAHAADNYTVLVTEAGGDTVELWTAPGGVQWRLAATSKMEAAPDLTSLAIGDGRYLASGRSTEPEIWVSANGANWHRRRLARNSWAWSNVVDVVSGPDGTLIHAIGGVSTTVEEMVVWTDDLREFTAVFTEGNPPFGGSGAIRIAAGAERYVAIRQHRVVQEDRPIEEWPIDHEALVSADGKTWTTAARRPFGPDADDIWVRDLAVREDTIYALVHQGESVVRLLQTTNLRSWTDISPPAIRSGNVFVHSLTSGTGGLLLIGDEAEERRAWFSSEGDVWLEALAGSPWGELAGAELGAVGNDQFLLIVPGYGDGPHPELWLGTARWSA